MKVIQIEKKTNFNLEKANDMNYMALSLPWSDIVTAIFWAVSFLAVMIKNIGVLRNRHRLNNNNELLLSLW